MQNFLFFLEKHTKLSEDKEFIRKVRDKIENLLIEYELAITPTID